MDDQSTTSSDKNTMTLREPRRKKRVRLRPRKSFPISIGGDDEWVVYTGHLSNLGVCVTHPYEIEALHSMGFFGKGSLSRSYPNFEKTRGGVPPVLRQRQWQRRQDWLSQAKTLDARSLCGDSNSENFEEREQLDAEDQTKQIEQTSGDGEKSPSGASNVEDQESTENVSKRDHKVRKDHDAKNSDDVDFPPEKRLKFSTSEATESAEKKKDKTIPDDEKSKNKRDDAANGISEVDVVKINVDPNKNSKVKTNTETKVDEVVLDSSEDEICEIFKSERSKFSAVNSGGDKDIILLVDEKMPRSLQEKNSSQTEKEETNTEDEIEMLEREVLVLPDSDSDIDDYLSKVKPRIKKEGFPVREIMYLTFEEAFFLTFGLGCLRIVDFDDNLLSILEAWDYFSHQRNDFVQKYVVYHYFRSNGWVVKPGLKYGGDFLLYKQGPPFYHASYIVIVEVLDADTLIRDETKTTRKMTWKKLFGLDRLSETAAKEILFAQVLWPSKLPRNKVPSSPELLSEFTVKELLYRRWIPKQNREEIDLADETKGSMK